MTYEAQWQQIPAGKRKIENLNGLTIDKKSRRLPWKWASGTAARAHWEMSTRVASTAQQIWIYTAVILRHLEEHLCPIDWRLDMIHHWGADETWFRFIWTPPPEAAAASSSSSLQRRMERDSTLLQPGTWYEIIDAATCVTRETVLVGWMSAESVRLQGSYNNVTWEKHDLKSVDILF